MDAALASGADLVVHLDGDGQHDPAYIPRLVAPILLGEADVVVGVRPLAEATEISPVRRRGNQIGSWVFRRTREDADQRRDLRLSGVLA